jgi:glycosyltransferase involved in cell wall biosynthesis
VNASPLVSVIMPTYQRVPYLIKALESALAQTYRNMEILVSDNAASSKVAGLVDSYKDPRVRYRHNGGNIGLMRNSLAAYREARGEFVASLHDDDMWEPTLLEELVPPLEADPTLVLSFSDHWVIRNDDTIDRQTTETVTRRWHRDKLQEGTYRPFCHVALADRAIPIGASVIRKSAIDWADFPEEIGAAYDLWIMYLACRGGGGAYYSPRRLLRYRWHGGAASASPHLQSRIYCYSRFAEDNRLGSVRRALQRITAEYRTSLGISLLREGRRQEARVPLLGGLTNAPELRGLLALALSLLPEVTFQAADRLYRSHLRRGPRRVTA